MRKTESLNYLIACGYQFPIDNPEDEYFRKYEPPISIIKIRGAIETINEPDRTIFLLFADNIPQTEICKITNRPAYTVSKSIKRTKAKLLKIIASAIFY